MIQRIQKKRLDQLLVERGLASTQIDAQKLILAGEISINPSTHQPLKAGSLISTDSKILLHPLPSYVSRGGEKLKSALTHWKIDVSGKVALDIGCSTGGFTDCLLKGGAECVFAIDVGYGQFDPKLRCDPRVQLFEKTHILKWSPPWMSEPKSLNPNFVTIDLSFISLRKVIPKLITFFTQDCTEFLILIKPQFEVEKRWLRKGIVKSEEKIDETVKDIFRLSKELGFVCLETYPCPIHGIKGNKEVWLRMVLENSRGPQL